MSLTNDRSALVARMDDSGLISIMQSSLYPGAKAESIGMVLSYCRARGLDPLRKPVHIVPMYVKPPGSNQGSMQDVVMPGIALYRIEAARTGEYAGKSEPEFGPTRTEQFDGVKVSFPEWCRVTVYRMVGGQRCEFTAKEYWLENYATAKRDTDAPNTMWKKRAFGQLAKCAEAQALRIAFPEATGGEATSEEMEGKVLAPDLPPAAGPTITSVSEPEREQPALTMLDHNGVERSPPDLARWVSWCKAAIGKMESGAALAKWREAMAPHMDAVAVHDDSAVAAVNETADAAMDTFAEEASHA